MQAVCGCEDYGQHYPDSPDAADVHKCRNERLSCSHEDGVSYDACSKSRFCPCFYAQYLGSEVDNPLVGSYERHCLRSHNPHYDAHECHDGGAESHANPGERLHVVLPLCSLALSYERGGSLADAVAGHIAQALHIDGERICRYGNGAERRDDAAYHYLSRTHHAALQAHWQSYAPCLLQYLARRDVTPE